IASSTLDRNILPSPIFPVLAVFRIVSTARFTSASGSTISSFILGSRSTVYSRPRYTSVCPFCRPWPRTSITVMPSTPISRSASFTDSNREGWMMASSFIMTASAPARSSRFEVVSFFAVLRHIQTFDFVFLAHAHADEHVGNLQQHKGAHQSKDPRDDRADELIAHLAEVSVEPADRRRISFHVMIDHVDRARCEHTCQKRPNCAADPVHAEGVERVIIAEDGFHARHHQVAHHAGDRSDDQRRHRRDEACRWRNGHK